MTDVREVNPEARTFLREAWAALERGEKGKATRLARESAALAPHWEVPWLIMAACTTPEIGLSHVARALEINPASKPAKKAIRWFIRRLPPEARRRLSRDYALPNDIKLKLIPMERLERRRLLSMRIGLPILGLVVGVGLWLGFEPAKALQPQVLSAPLPKASLTPTATNTPTITPTSTPTSTLTLTPTPSMTPTPTITPTPRPNVSWSYSLDPEELANEGRWIDVDIGNQLVTAYEGATPVASFVVSTGTAAHPTVEGQFRIWIKLRATDMSGPGYYLPDVPYTMYFYQGYALHGTYWHDNFGTPMSHGCVNLRISDSEWLFEFASVGTLVNVHP